MSLLALLIFLVLMFSAVRFSRVSVSRFWVWMFPSPADYTFFISDSYWLKCSFIYSIFMPLLMFLWLWSVSSFEMPSLICIFIIFKFSTLWMSRSCSLSHLAVLGIFICLPGLSCTGWKLVPYKWRRCFYDGFFVIYLGSNCALWILMLVPELPESDEIIGALFLLLSAITFLLLYSLITLSVLCIY